jgi:ATP citrate (pro-S)-lyase
MLLGEVGGTEEYKVAEAIQTGRITKPVIAWCIGTCAGMFGAEVQFGHAGALANSNIETAEAKNSTLREAGAIVPNTFEQLPIVLEATYKKLVKQGTVHCLCLLFIVYCVHGLRSSSFCRRYRSCS